MFEIKLNRFTALDYRIFNKQGMEILKVIIRISCYKKKF